MVEVSLPLEQRIRFFVYIIESPNPPDLYHKRYEGDMLERALILDSIPSSHRIAVNQEAFKAALLVGLEEQMKLHKNLIPIIHISAHGSTEGVGLTSGEVITWESLKKLLLPINRAMKGSLILCMSSCEGYAACEMAMSEEDELPFFAVVGHVGKPSWSDTAVAYTAFYHLVSKGCYVSDAVKAMREASGETGFMLIIGSKVKERFVEFIKQKKAGEIRRKLEEEINKIPPSREATNLEKGKS